MRSPAADAGSRARTSSILLAWAGETRVVGTRAQPTLLALTDELRAAGVGGGMGGIAAGAGGATRSLVQTSIEIARRPGITPATNAFTAGER